MRLRIALLLLCVATPGFSQAVASRQVLDRVYSFSAGAVLSMNFGNLDQASPFQNLGLQAPSGSSLNIATCTVTAIGGVYCLDGQVVRQWANPLQPAVSVPVLNCATDLGVSLGKGDGCVAMTVDLTGQIWLAVKKRNSHSVYKVVRAGSGSCTTAPFCVSEPYFGRPPIVDLVPVDGDLAEVFKPCAACARQAGVMGIEERKNAVFFPDAAGQLAVVVVKATDWDLKSKELLQDISVVQLAGTTASGPVTSILATTTTGRVLTRGTTETGKARPLQGVPAACAATAEVQYGIRASSTTGIIYVSDSNCRKVTALEPNGSTFATFTALNYITELSTSIAGESYAITGLTIAPGISIDLTSCFGTTVGCALVNGPDGQPAARLLSVQLAAGSQSGATVFQIKGIPDCRQAPLLAADKRAVCAAASGVVIDSSGNAIAINAVTGALSTSLPAAALRLNVTPLLPSEVLRAFEASRLRPDGTLPPLLISRQYRAQQRTGYIFEAFFVLPQPEVFFTDTFTSEYEVGILEGLVASVNDCDAPASLIQWDVTTHVSELYPGADGTFVDTLSNIGCGSIRGAGASLSLLPYDLQVNPDTWNPDTLQYTAGNDAVFARLLQVLYRELYDVQRLYACTNADAGIGATTPAPIGSSLCATLTDRWSNGLRKLDDCIGAAFQPKSSAGNELCQAFVSQLTNYQASLPAATPPQDIANRVGELKARILTLFHLYEDRFQPSIPDNGFCRESSPPASTACPNPWT
jgi:hypothetical protein